MVFQSMNQIYNFGINYSNSAASNEKSFNDTAISLGLTIGAALGISIGGRKILQSVKSKNVVVRGLLFMTAYLGVAGSSTVNLFLSRYKDLAEGIEMLDPETGLPRSDLKSKKAGLQGTFF